MADLVPVGVTALRCAQRTVRVAGEAGNAGAAVYHNQVDGKWYKADANFSDKAAVRGIAVTAFALNGPIVLAVSGDIDLGVATVDGTIYCLSSTSLGGICPWVDLLAGDFVTILGVGKIGNVLGLSIYRSATAKP